jgi:hypothetical protein
MKRYTGKKLYAVVHAEVSPLQIVEDTGAPFEGEDIEQAEAEVFSTYGPEGEDVEGWFKGQGWSVVPLTPELEAQYRALEGKVTS